MISIVTTVRCGPVTLLARTWLPAFDTAPAAPTSEGFPCPVDCSGGDCWGTTTLFPDPGEDPPPPLGLSCDIALEAPAAESEGALVDCETPVVPWVEVSVEKPFALPAGPGDWEEDPVSVGAE